MELTGALRAFTRQSAGADVSLVFYAGHGIEMDGVNYLVPVDARLERDVDVRFEAVTVDDLPVSTSGASLRLLILDASRNNPLARSMQRTAATRTVSGGRFADLNEGLLGDETLVASCGPRAGINLRSGWIDRYEPREPEIMARSPSGGEMSAMFHLTARVAWHDSGWDGSVCQAPSCNSFCTALDRIRDERDDTAEDALAGTPWNTLAPEQHPPCQAESGAFMNGAEWRRRFRHPYADIDKTAETHGHLKPTWVRVPPFATFVVPFAWMLRSEQDAIDERLPTLLPPDERSPFSSSPWVFGRARQKALLDLFSSRLTPGSSLVFFYCKEGQPFGDTISRLVVGAGRINRVAAPKAFDVDDGERKPTQLMWDILIHHSIRPDGHDGFLLPYHEYIEPTGDPAEDERRLDLLREIAVPADPAHMRTFSYAAEHASPDIALSTLVRCLESVRKIKQHGIAAGPWERREEWLNDQIAAAWQDRGAFPGLGSAPRSARHAAWNGTDPGASLIGRRSTRRRSMANC